MYSRAAFAFFMCRDDMNATSDQNCESLLSGIS